MFSELDRRKEKQDAAVKLSVSVEEMIYREPKLKNSYTTE